MIPRKKDRITLSHSSLHAEICLGRRGERLLKIFLIINLLGLAISAQALPRLRFASGSLDIQKLPLLHLSQLSAVEGSTDSYAIAQFPRGVQAADLQTFKKLQIPVLRYIPDEALIVKITAKQLQQLQQMPQLQLAAYQGVFKLSPNLETLSIFNSNRKLWVRVGFFGHGLQDLEVTPSEILKLTQDSRVEFVEPVPTLQFMHMPLQQRGRGTSPSLSDFEISGFETGTRVMGFESLWSQGFSGEGQIIGVADSGLDSGNMNSLRRDFADAVIAGQAFGLGSESWGDTLGHGTHTSGSIVGRGSAENGQLTGGAPQARLVMQSLWSSLISNMTVPPQIARVYDAAYEKGVRIHNNSWGSPKNLGAYDSSALQVDDYAWKHPDLLLVFSAGNSGADLDRDGRIDPGTVGSPGTAKNVLTVGSSENVLHKGGIQSLVSELEAASQMWPVEPISSSKLSDQINGLAIFSARGPTQDGRLKPDIVAPGTNILSVKSSLMPLDENYWGAFSENYIFNGGTSMSAPLVSAAAALVRELLIRRHHFANPSAALVKAVLLHTATDMFPGQYGSGTRTQEIQKRRPNSDEGYGRLNLESVAALGEASKLIEGKIHSGEILEYSVSVRDGLLVNLVYTDAPGSPTADVALVNDLDLEIVDPNGQVLSQPDHLNPHEVFESRHLTPGSYKIRVKVSRLVLTQEAGTQPFSLVYTAL